MEKAPWKPSWRGKTTDAGFKTFKILQASIGLTQILAHLDLCFWLRFKTITF